jgi:hypothetical protein
MTSTIAFNQMYGQFLEELHSTFPEETIIKKIKNRPMDSKTCKKFMNKISQFSTELMQRDDAFFCKENELVMHLGLLKIWGVSSAATKDAIWGFLSNLYMIGTTISMFPPEMMSAIENMAESYSQKIPEGSAPTLSGIQNMLMSDGNLMGMINGLIKGRSGAKIEELD